MLRRQATRLLASVVVAVSSLVAFATVTQANPITIHVTGDVYDYLSFRYNFHTGYAFYITGRTGSLSGTFSWDPALMGQDFSSPPTVSWHEDIIANHPTPWLTARLSAVTPDFKRTYDPATSGLPQLHEYLLGVPFVRPEDFSTMQTFLGYYNRHSEAVAAFRFYNSPFAPALGYQSGEFVPVRVDYVPLAGKIRSGYMWTSDARYDRNGFTVSRVTAYITSTSTVPDTVPEPGTVALVGAGLVGLVARRRVRGSGPIESNRRERPV